MDFYKILNKNECHNDLQYKTGLNIDPLKFNPSGDCEPGGIYFSREDILTFLDYGPWIRKVTLPKDAQIYENPDEPKKWKADRVILGKREAINLKVIKRLIKEGANPQVNDDYPLRWAATYGYIKIVKFLSSLFNSKLSNNEALRCAAINGHIDIVKLLIPVSKDNNTVALRYAAEKGYTEIVKLLIPVSDPKANNSEALQAASIYGNTEIVKLLIPVSDPKANKNYALKWAIDRGHLDIVKLLLPVSEINDEVIIFCKKYCTESEIYDLIIADKSI